MARRAALAALALAAALPACATGDEPDPSTEQQIRGRIANLATLRGNELASNIEILGVYMRPLSVPYLIEALEGDPSPRVRAGSAQALGLSQDGRAVEPLARAADSDSNPGVRYTAAYGLCLFRDARGLPVLFEALRSDDPLNRRLASDGLRRLTGLDFGYLPEDPREKREAAVANWEAWYRELGPEGAAARLVPTGATAER